MTLADAGERLDQILNRDCSEDWDSVGWMVGPTSESLKGILLAVDPSQDALDATIDRDCNLLLTHHPLIFDSLDRLVEGNPVHDTIMRAVRQNIGIYSAHTNLDSMEGGLNDFFAEQFNLSNVDPIQPHDTNDDAGIGRMGELPKALTVESIRDRLREEIEPSIAECVGPTNIEVETLGICTGSGGDFIGPELNRQVDLYVTADVDHHEAMTARELGLPLIILDHYEMESVFIPRVRSLLDNNSQFDVPIESYRRDNPYHRWIDT